MRRTVLATVLVVLAACQDTLPTTPLATPSVLAGYGTPVDKNVQRVPLDFTVAGPCINELLAVSGTLNVTSTVWASASKLRIKSHLNGNLAGVGLTTGLTYRHVQVSGSDYEMETSTGVAESDQVFVFHVISATAAPDFHLMMNGTQHYDPLLGAWFEPKQWTVMCR